MMKTTTTKTLTLIALLLVFATSLLADTNELAAFVQRGLFEEEANRNLEAAILAYQGAVAQHDKDRQLAATALFRLGECYRKQGKTNEANLQYQRILRDFSDKTQLVALSQANLMEAKVSFTNVNMGAASPVASAEEEEIQRIKAMLRDSPDLINAKNFAVRENAYGTPLHQAAEKGQLKVALFLLANHAEVNSRATDDRTPLHLATIKGHKAMVELLLDNGADIDAIDGARQGDGYLRQTPLCYATQAGYKAVVETLLAHKANVNAVCGDGRTALFLADQKGQTTIAEMLVTNGADVNFKDGSGITPLHRAAFYNNSALAELLLRHKADVNLKDRDGNTPLFKASGKGAAAVVKLLLDHGADINATNSAGITPLMIASSDSDSDTVKTLLAHNPDLNARDNQGSTAVHWAAARGNVEVLGLLLEKKPNLEIRDRSGKTTLLSLIPVFSQNSIPGSGANRDTQFLQSVEALLRAGADPNAVVEADPNAETPLFWAIRHGRKDLVELLIAHGVKINILNKQGETPLSLTKPATIVSLAGTPIRMPPGFRNEETLPQIAEALLKAGANENLQRLSEISVRRAGDGTNSVVFMKGTNTWNHYTLLEAIAALYATPERITFPDFAHVTINRLAADGKSMEISGNAQDIMQAGDATKDVWLQWGDIVEIPQLEHRLNDVWGLSKTNWALLKNYLRRNVQLAVKGKSTTLTLDPMIEYTPNLIGYDFKRELLLFPVINKSGLLLSSSDTKRARVKRTDPVTKQTQEMLFYAPEIFCDQKTDLWLREGDIIEIPER